MLSGAQGKEVFIHSDARDEEGPNPVMDEPVVYLLQAAFSQRL